jgi:hypothetical protein
LVGPLFKVLTAFRREDARAGSRRKRPKPLRVFRPFG